MIQEPEVDVNPATCSIVPGKECTIEIQKGKSGLGLSIVGGSDTLLVGFAYVIISCWLDIYISVLFNLKYIHILVCFGYGIPLLHRFNTGIT